MEHLKRIESLLRGLALFQSFPSTELRRLITQSQVRTVAPGETIIRFGQPGRFLGVILRGEAEAVITDLRGEQRSIGRIKQGGFLGEMSLLTGEPTSADVVAREESELLMIPQEAFSRYLAADVAALRVMAKTITERLRGREGDETARARIEDAWRSVPDPYGLRLSTTTPMKILVVNCGSSSLKYAYFDTAAEENNCEGIVERIGLQNARSVHSSRFGAVHRELGPVDHVQAFGVMVAQLTDPAEGVLRSLHELVAVGHRVVHGGDRHAVPTLIDAEVIRHIEESAPLAPLHNPLNLMAIRKSLQVMPGVPQVAVFDTGFHLKMPLQAYLYGLPYEYYEQDHIRRYGFHGISHQYVALQAAASLKRDFRQMKIITCHLGNGASVCAIDHGRSVDTSMGLTPLEGLLMGTRCGDLDPSVVLYLMREKGLSIEGVDDLLNRHSGLKGLSGISNDFREVEKAADAGDLRALYAIQVFCYRIRKYIGSYVAALGGLDALVFTGGIGEGSARVRSMACQGLSYMGILVDDARNRATAPSSEAADISAEESRVQVLVIPTDEARMIARETIRTLGYQDVARVIRGQRDRAIPIEVSAHHIHLSHQDVGVLFGEGYELTPSVELSQPRQFACEERVTLIGPRGRVERVRVLGPVRSRTQVEISMTEEFQLGIKAPIRPSGDLDGSPGVTLQGPKGTCELQQGVICALRHIHMTPEDALTFGLKDGDICMVRVEGERGLIFGDILVRTSPDFRLRLHLDTDEANAANIQSGMVGYLAGVQDRR